MAVARARKTKSRQKSLPPDMLAGRLARLRPLRAADRITSVRWRNDRDIRDNVLGYRFPITEAMEADWVGLVCAQCRVRPPHRRAQQAWQGACQGSARPGRRLCFRDAQSSQALPAGRRVQQAGVGALSRVRLRGGRCPAPAGVPTRTLLRRCADGPDPQPRTPSDLTPATIDTRYACESRGRA